MTRRDLLAFIFRYKASILGWWFFVAVLVGVLVYLRPQTYEATSSILVERTLAPVVTNTVHNTPDMAEAMNTEMEILSARPVLEASIKTLGLDAEAPKEEESEGKPVGRKLAAFLVDIGLRNEVAGRDALIADLASGLKAARVVDSNVLTVSYKSDDPLFAMKVVNAVTDAYIAHRRSIYAARGLSNYFKARMVEAGEQLDELRKQLADDRQAVEGSSMADTKDELVRRTVSLRDRLTALRAEKADLRSRFAETHPRVAVVNENIAAASRELQTLTDQVGDLDQLNTKIQQLQVLIDNQESLYLDYKTQYEQELARETAPDNLVNARVIAYASLPAAPKHSRLFFIQLGLAAGLMLGVLMAFVRAYFDNRALDPEQVEKALGVPVLASIPKSGAIRRL